MAIRPAGVIALPMNARYAIYFIPEPGTKLSVFGSALLGRNSESGKPTPRPVFNGLPPEDLRACTVDAGRYGLHATLKAPFFLADGFSEKDLLERAAAFAVNKRGIILPRLKLARIGFFLALVPSGQTAEDWEAVENLNALAAETLSFFDSFRAAPSEQELARREPQKLSVRQRELLAKWGYPYVLDEYRFHITLTDKLHDEAQRRVLEENLRVWLATALYERTVVSSICVCKQAEPSSNDAFTLLKRINFLKDRRQRPSRSP